VLTVLAGDVLADRTGDGPTRVLALHGWGRSGADFAEILHGCDALAVHLPGFGTTAPPPTVWGSEDYAEHLVPGLAGSGPVVVVGHSFGGRVAVRLAVAHPELVSALVLTGVPLVRATPPPRPALALRVAKRLRAAHLVPESVVERCRGRGGSADYRAAQGVMRDVLVRVVREDYRDDLARRLLEAATQGGAYAIGHPQLGRLAPGAPAALAHVTVDDAGAGDLASEILRTGRAHGVPVEQAD